MMRKVPPTALLILLVLSAAPVSGGKPIAPADYARINAALVETHVLPRYARLSAATEAFAAAAREFCAGDDPSDGDRVRTRFHDTMAAWMGVQHLRFGPAELFMRADRFHFWPQARGKVARARAHTCCGWR